MTTPQGAPDWTAPGAQTADTPTLGVGPVTLAQGASQLYVLPVFRRGYNIRLELWNITNTTATLPVSVDVEWVDQFYNIAIAHQTWWAFAGSVADTHLIRGRGFTEGDQLKITVTNHAATAVSLNFKLHVVMSDRQYDTHEWRTHSQGTDVYTGLTAAADDSNASVLATVSQSVAGNGNATLALPLWSGEASIAMFTTSGLADFSLNVSAAADAALANTPAVLQLNTASNGKVTALFVLPRVQCTLVIFNTNGAAQTLVAAITSLERG